MYRYFYVIGYNNQTLNKHKSEFANFHHDLIAFLTKNIKFDVLKTNEICEI